MILYEYPPPHSNPKTFLGTAHTPCCGIAVESLAVGKTDCPASIDNVASNMEDGSTK
jgi:hypothetical protein